MRVRSWQDMLEEVAGSDVDPDGWRAVGGARAAGVGEDVYFGHPRAGVYHLKTYAKNPFEVRGVGARVARSLDDEIGAFLPDRDSGGRFAMQDARELDEDVAEERATRLEATVEAHADAPTTPGDLFDDVMDAVDSPAFGPMEFDLADRPNDLRELGETFDEAERLLEAEFEDLVAADEIDRGFQ